VSGLKKSRVKQNKGTSMNLKPTKRQKQILDFIDRTVRKTGGQSPTMQEIADHFEFASINAVQDHIRLLLKKGLIYKEAGKARSIRVVKPTDSFRGQVVDIPVFGAIPAGYADNREEDVVGCISVDVDTLGVRANARTFALEVSGDSMIGRHICDGDHVICQHGQDPKNGDIVAALIDNESTLKTFVTRRNRPFLRAENPRYPELIPANELVIQGVVQAVIRKV